MSDEKPSLHIDLDWKKQAQEEKRRLEEEEKQRAEEAAKRAAPPAPVPGAITGAGATVGSPPDPTAGGRDRTTRGTRELPKASIQALVSTVVTQAMLYMGEVPTSSGQTMVNLDIAKLQVDTLGVLEEKTRGNLTEDEQSALDLALYEVRTRFINAAQQIINGAA